MKTKTIKTLIVGSVVALISMGGIGEVKAEREGHGGDVFELDQNHSKAFDKAEYEIPFMPSQHPETREVFETFIAPQISILKEKLPKTGAFIEGLWMNQGPLWYFVKAELKEQNDEGDSNLSLEWNKKQIAIYHEGVVQINYDLFKELSKSAENEIPSIAYLLTHELFWDAIEENFPQVVNGDKIRRLSGLFLNPFISEMTGPTIARHMLDSMSETSPLAQILKMDLAIYNQNNKSPFSKYMKFKGFGVTVDQAEQDALSACNNYLDSFPSESTTVEVERLVNSYSTDGGMGPSYIISTFDVYQSRHICGLEMPTNGDNVRENLYFRKATLDQTTNYKKVRTHQTKSGKFYRGSGSL